MIKHLLFLIPTLALVLLAAACTASAPTVTPTTEATPGAPAADLSENGGGAAPTTDDESPAMLTGFPDVATVAERVGPSVVLVRARREETDRSGRTSVSTSRGSGVIFDPAGYILTNNHVVEDATFVDIVLSTGQELDIEIIGTDPNTDLAVLKIDPNEVENLVVTPLADSTSARIGDWVIAIGNPLGFEGSVTVGVISAKDRSLPLDDVRLHDLLQTDAVINPGNSGGPLLNLNGEIIGINTAIIRGRLASGQEAEGIGFAVATTTAIPVVAQIIENGRVIWPRIGVSIDDVTPANAEELGLSVDQGVLVVSLAAGGPAEAAGIEPNDVIVALDGELVTKFTDLRRLMLSSYSVGDTVTVTVVRSAVTLEFDVTLDELVF